MSIIGWAITILAAGFGSFLGGYFKKKGENQAIREDMGKLVEQVRAVTTATKEIEAKISSDVWNRQREWEMKREVMFETTKAMGTIRNAIDVLFSSALHRNSDDPKWTAENLRARQAWDTASDAIEETTIRVAIVCDNTTYDAVSAFSEMARRCAELLAQNRETEARPLLMDLVLRHYAVIHALRAELGIKEIETPST